MRLRPLRPWILLLSLATACADDPAATTTAVSATTTATDTTDATEGSAGSTDAASTSGDAGSTEVASTSGGDQESSGVATTSGDVESTGTTDDEGSTGDTDGPLLPGCGDAPPRGFDAVPSAPADGATIAAPAAALEVTLSGEILAEATATFHLREVHTLSDADDFTIVVMPDTQNYTQFPGNYPQYQAQTQWIWDHRNSDRIVAVLHNGDVVQHGNQQEIEWERADQAMTTLETQKPNFPDGIAYGIAVGNHDNGAHAHDDIPFSTHLFNKYFGVARFKDRAYYGGHYGKRNDNSWIIVRAGNLDVVMVNLEYRGALGQDPAILEWAKEVFEAHPHALGIVNSHHIVRADGGFSGQGKEIYAAMKAVANVQLMTSGHIKEIRARRSDTFKGHTIHSMLADYQDLILPAEKCAGGCGYLRLWRFSPQKNQLRVETYSPSLDKYMTGPQEQFTLSVDLSAATGVFTKVGSTSGPGEALALAVDDLEPGASYEWYAVVKQCGVKITTPTWRFTAE